MYLCAALFEITGVKGDQFENLNQWVGDGDTLENCNYAKLIYTVTTTCVMHKWDLFIRKPLNIWLTDTSGHTEKKKSL